MSAPSSSSSIIGSIIERGPSTSPKDNLDTISNNLQDEGIRTAGFPSVQHRSIAKAKFPSAFTRAREAEGRRARATTNGSGSLFARAVTRDASSSSNSSQPLNSSLNSNSAPRDPDSDDASWRTQVSQENAARVEAMTDEEREDARVEIVQRFGEGIGDILRRIRMKREEEEREKSKVDEGTDLKSNSTNATSHEEDEDQMPPLEDIEPTHPSYPKETYHSPRPTSPNLYPHSILRTPSPSSSPRISSPSPLRSIFHSGTSTPTSMNPNKRKLRFIDPTPSDVHIYESAPPSPKRVAGLLTPPSLEDDLDKTVVKLPSLKAGDVKMRWENAGSDEFAAKDTVEDSNETKTKDTAGDNTDVNSSEVTQAKKNKPEDEEPEEGTPEYIRRKFFPQANPNDPSLQWITTTTTSPTFPPTSNSSTVTPSTTSSSSSKPATRFSLTGRPLAADQISNLPTHLGLHHHAGSPSEAGYTLDDIFLLARSTYGAQRVGMVGVLGRVVEFAVSFEHKRDEGEVWEFSTKSKRETFRRKAVAVGLEALEGGSKSGIGAGVSRSLQVNAVQVLWECIVRWDDGYGSVTWADDEVDEDIENAWEHIELCPPPKSKSVLSSSLSTNSDNQESTSSTSDSDTANDNLSSEIDTDTLLSLPTPALLSHITTHLVAPILPPSSLSQLLQILYKLCLHSNTICDEIIKTTASAATGSGSGELLRGVVDTFLLDPANASARNAKEAAADDGEAAAQPNPLALRLINLLALSSRANAEYIISSGIADALLRFVMFTPLGLENPKSMDAKEAKFMCRTFDLYATLAAYGMYANVAGMLSAQLPALTSSILSFSSSNSNLIPSTSKAQARTKAKIQLSYLTLLENWLTCARDPHQTTPEHDILWNQVVSWGWGEELMRFREELVSSFSSNASLLETRMICTHLWHTGSAWLAGCRVNSVKGGADERELVVEHVMSGFVDENGMERKVVEDALRDVQTLLGEFGEDSEAWEIGKLTSLENGLECLQAYVQFCLACWPLATSSSALPATHSHPLCPPSLLGILTKLVRSILQSSLLSASSRTSIKFYTFSRPLTSLLAHFMRLQRVLETISKDDWLRLALGVLSALQIGDEEYAGWIIDEAVGNLSSSSSENVKFNKKQVDILRPFIEHSIRPRNDIIVSSYVPSSTSLKGTTTHRIPSTCRSKAPPFGLPLRKTWPTFALDHLLRSGASAVFQNLPAEWNADEIDVVKASLGLTLAVQELFIRRSEIEIDLNRLSLEEAVFTCMKVFMLEHGQQHDDSSEEVFRDSEVGRLMENVLQPFTFSNISVPNETKPKGVRKQATLEDISKPFLGDATPFYQFYTDFVGLYDALSFSHRLFSRLLLVPISMRYPVDYRKYLWGDYGHVMRILRVPIEQAITDDIREYFYPIEENPEMLSWYLRALFKWPLDGLVYFIAVHHVACNIWPDLQRTGTASVNGISNSAALKSHQSQTDEFSARRRKLLRAVIHQGTSSVIQDLFRYKQQSLLDGADLRDLRLPPTCFDLNYQDNLDGDWKTQRLECLLSWEGQSVKEQYGKILSSS